MFRGEVNINPVAGAALPGGGDGVTEVVYTSRGGNTFLLADDNDNGLLDGTDFAVRFSGVLDFTEDDFTDQTDFIIAGTNGNDTILGTEEDDVIFGLAGNDTIQGLGGNDTIDGGAGDDTITGGPGAGSFDDLFGGDGNDTISLVGSEFGGNADGGAGDDLLIGSDSESVTQLAQRRLGQRHAARDRGRYVPPGLRRRGRPVLTRLEPTISAALKAASPHRSTPRSTAGSPARPRRTP